MSTSVIFNPITGAALLRKKRRELQLERKNYQKGEFVGHPEEQLELIENLQAAVREVEDAQTRGWEPSTETISKAVSARNSWVSRRDLMLSELGTHHYEHVLKRLEERAHWAILGLI